jgi:hypothetical protein
MNEAVMIDFMKRIVVGQFEAALAMLGECVRRCPAERWEERMAAYTVRQLAYHTLYFVDLYLSRGEAAFEPRELHQRGGDEREPVISAGLSQQETLEYLAICRQKLLEALAAETEESLRGPSGFSWLSFSRGELHLYNLRHVQHHAAQLSAHLRRVEPAFQDRRALPWVATGWRGESTKSEARNPKQIQSSNVPKQRRSE